VRAGRSQVVRPRRRAVGALSSKSSIGRRRTTSGSPNSSPTECLQRGRRPWRIGARTARRAPSPRRLRLRRADAQRVAQAARAGAHASGSPPASSLRRSARTRQSSATTRSLPPR
jgi:hypothetical protein